MALFGRFSITACSLLSLHWPIFSRHSPLATVTHRHSLAQFPFIHPSAQPAEVGRAQGLPRWGLLADDYLIAKEQTGPDLDERSTYFSMSPNRAIHSDR